MAITSPNRILVFSEDTEEVRALLTPDSEGRPERKGAESGNTVPPSPDRLEAYLDQVLLRIFLASPGLASYIESSRVVPASGHVEVSFYRVPDEVVSAVIQAFGIPVEELHYTKGGSACYGFRAQPSKEDLSSLGVDDSDQSSDEDDRDPLDNEAKESAELGQRPVSAEADELLRAPA